jgi:hypothetical protein
MAAGGERGVLQRTELLLLEQLHKLGPSLG